MILGGDQQKEDYLSGTFVSILGSVDLSLQHTLFVYYIVEIVSCSNLESTAKYNANAAH